MTEGQGHPGERASPRPGPTQEPASTAPIRIGTRGSDLALWQARWVRDAIRTRLGRPCELVIVKTSGDVHTDVSLARLGARLGTVGLFTKELERALLAREVDVAVHSLKDMPTDVPPGLRLAARPVRAAVNDVLLVNAGRAAAAGPLRLPAGARVGTSSVRRRLLLLADRPDLDLVTIRGNVPTRVNLARTGEVDAVVLAAAGLDRLGLDLSGLVRVDLDPRRFVPAPGQGALALECRADDAELLALLGRLDDPGASAATESERLLLHGVGAGCSVPLGALATVVTPATRATRPGEGPELAEARRLLMRFVDGERPAELDLRAALAAYEDHHERHPVEQDEQCSFYGVLLYEAAFAATDELERARLLVRARDVLRIYQKISGEAWDVVDGREADATAIIEREGLEAKVRAAAPGHVLLRAALGPAELPRGRRPWLRRILVRAADAAAAAELGLRALGPIPAVALDAAPSTTAAPAGGAAPGAPGIVPDEPPAPRPRRLAGKRVLVLREPERARELLALLEDEGAVAAARAVTSDRPVATGGVATAAFAGAAGTAGGWVVFASAAAVRHVAGLDPVVAGGLRGRAIAAVGPSTAQALAEAELPVDLVADEGTGAGLARALLARFGAARPPVLLPAARGGRTELRDALAAAGCAVTVDELYASEALAAPNDAELDVDAVVVASPSGARAALTGRAGHVKAVAIGPTTADALRELGLTPAAVASAPTPVDVVDAVVRALG